MGEKMVTVATFNFATDPNFLIFKIKLKEANIPFNAAEEHTVGVDPLLSITLGGIRVLVNESDAPRAIEILNDINQTEITPENIEIEIGDSDTVLDEVFYKIVPTQSDGSSQAYFYLVIALTVLLIVALFVMLIISI
jgi:hypothetical protein